MARQSFFAEKLEAFNSRMMDIWKFTPDDFNEDAAALKARITRLQSEDPSHAKALETTFYDMLAFFDGMSLHQNNVKSDTIFEDLPAKARTVKALESTLPTCVTNSDDIPFRAYQDIWHFHCHEFMQAIDFFSSAFNDRFPFTMTLTQDVPIGLICYSPAQKQWILFEGSVSTEKTFRSMTDLIDDLYDKPDFREASSLQIELHLPRRALIAARDAVEAFNKSIEHHHLKQLTPYKMSTDDFLSHFFTAARGGMSHFKTCITHSGPFSEDNESVAQFLMTKACSLGYQEIIEILLRQGVSPNIMTDSNWPMLIHATVQERYDIVGTLLSHGASVNAINPKQSTALHHATRLGHLRLVQRLIRFGADPNTINNKGASPLLVAVKHNSLPLVRVLIAAGARLDIHDHFNNNPLLWACRILSVELIEYLLKKQKQTVFFNKGGENPLSIVCQKDTLNIATLLFRYGAPVSLINHRDRSGYNALHYTILNQNLELVRLLLSHGASAYVTDKFGNTPLHLAIAHSSLPIGRLILDHEPEALLMFNQARKTPLNLACHLSKVEIIPSLLEHTPILNQDLFGANGLTQYTADVQTLLYRHQYYKLLQSCIRHPLISVIEHPLKTQLNAILLRREYNPIDSLRTISEAVDRFLAEQAARVGCFGFFLRRPPEHLMRLARAINLLHDPYSLAQMEAFMHLVTPYMPHAALHHPALAN